MKTKNLLLPWPMKKVKKTNRTIKITVIELKTITVIFDFQN